MAFYDGSDWRIEPIIVPEVEVSSQRQVIWQDGAYRLIYDDAENNVLYEATGTPPATP
jgi:hypothetical protein